MNHNIKTRITVWGNLHTKPSEVLGARPLQPWNTKRVNYIVSETQAVFFEGIKLLQAASVTFFRS